MNGYESLRRLQLARLAIKTKTNMHIIFIKSGICSKHWFEEEELVGERFTHTEKLSFVEKLGKHECQ